MARYRIHIPLWRFEGAKSGRVYNCTRGAAYEAPEGEFKQLLAGREYSRIDTAPEEAAQDGGPQTADGSDVDPGAADDPQSDDDEADDS